MKPALWYKTYKGAPFENFCSDAAIGARNCGIETKSFSDIKDVPYNPYNIIVSSVEDCLWWVGKDIPPIDDSWATDLKGREEKLTTIEVIKDYPCFIKPADKIKAFTGIVVESYKEAKEFTDNYKGLVRQQEIVEIESEYRIYITEDRVLGIKHYLGDPFISPEKETTERIIKTAKENLKELSYTLDIGITKENKTILIEINDGWAIGNYGLDPNKYYQFVKNRWLQLTGVRR